MNSNDENEIAELKREEHEHAEQMMKRMMFWLYVSFGISVLLLIIGIFFSVGGK